MANLNLDAVIAQRADTYGLAPARLARAYAELSGGRALAECVHLGDTLLYAVTQQAHTVWDDEMSAAAERVGCDSEMVTRVRERALCELSDPVERAVWLAAYVEAYASPFYRELREDGTHGEIARGDDGKYAEAQRASLVTLVGAVIALDWDESEHPRDPDGKFAGGGGEGGTSGGGGHPGKGYSKDAYVDKDGVIHTSNVYDAQRALSEKRKVDLEQIKQVSTLIDRLGETAKEMAAQGREAPVFNLCDVSVEGTNIFCSEHKGIPRAEMPVIARKATKDFVRHLKSLGYKVEKDKEQAQNLRATQSEISGAKVAASMTRIKAEGFYKRLVISRDDYILDGHHTWAGQLGLDAQDNNLRGDKDVKVYRVDISITKLIEEAEKWTGGAGKKPASEAAKEWDESAHPRVPAGSPDGGQFGEGGGGGKEGGTSGGKGGGKKGKVKVDSVEEFRKDKVEVHTSKTDKFIETWNDAIGLDPGDFKDTFLGHLPGTMEINHRYYEDEKGVAYENRLQINGNLQDEEGRSIGSYTRTIDLKNNKASSDYFSLSSSVQGKGEGKQLLAANVEMYQELGLDKVDVHANIDVGGYAWAKYGYVPTQDSWNDLRDTLKEKLDQGGGGAGYTPDEWDAMSADNQDRVFQEWKESTHDKFYESEVESWRESGEPLDEAKYELAKDFYGGDAGATAHAPEWAVRGMEEWRSGRDESVTKIPFTNAQILAAVSVDYSKGNYGNDDPTIEFDDSVLDSLGADLVEPTLPGIEEIKPHELLNEGMRNGIEKELIHAFNKRAESDAGDMDPPDWVGDNVTESQESVWDSMAAREKFRYADRNGLIEEIEDEEGPSVDVQGSERDDLYALLDDEDPKAIWAVADAPGGKELLLGSDWSGAINFKDKDTMTRFNAYVGKVKQSAEKAAA